MLATMYQNTTWKPVARQLPDVRALIETILQNLVRTMEWGDGVLIDVDPNGRVLGIEVLDASTRFDADTLASLRVPEVRLTLAEAAAESGLSPSTLRVQLNSGRLSGKKQGRDWTVTLADLWNHLESRAASGRPARSRKARRLRATGRRVR